MARVVVDKRERKLSSKLFSLGVEHQLRPLNVGDVQVSGEHGEFIFERKTLPDFVSSVMDGRLDNQLTRLMMAGNSFLVLEMTGKIFSDMNRGALFAKIAKIAWISLATGKIAMIPSRNIMDTARIIKYFYDHIDDPDLEIGFTRPKLKLSKSDVVDWKIFVLTGFPYVGEKRARALLEKCGWDLLEAIRSLPVDESLPKNVREKARELLGE